MKMNRCDKKISDTVNAYNKNGQLIQEHTTEQMTLLDPALNFQPNTEQKHNGRKIRPEHVNNKVSTPPPKGNNTTRTQTHNSHWNMPITGRKCTIYDKNPLMYNKYVEIHQVKQKILRRSI
jgi:hypothetical protein